VTLPAEAKQAGARFFLEVSAVEAAPRLGALILGAKVSNPSRIDTLRDHALPGVATEAQPGQPTELPPGQTATYFRLKHETNEWSAHVVPANELLVFVMGAPEDVKVNLIVVLPMA
jgi:predicted component of type VI protein secretion system